MTLAELNAFCAGQLAYGRNDESNEQRYSADPDLRAAWVSGWDIAEQAARVALAQ